MNIAIIGTGKIVVEMLPVVMKIEGIQVTALCSRPQSREKAERLAAIYSIPQVYDDYDLMLRQHDIDFVYVALVNSAHFEYAQKALHAGKNVIIEKPICTSTSELDELVKLALASHLYIFEAVTLLHMPHYRVLKEELLPQIGRVKMIECNYSQRSSRYDMYLQGELTPAFDTACFGGALTDINIYNIHFVVSLFGEPKAVVYHQNTGFNGIDTSGVSILHYSDFVATCIGSKDSDGYSFGSIQGDGGWIQNIGPVSTMSQLKIYASGEERMIDEQPKYHRLQFEFEHFRDIFHDYDYDTMLHYLDISHQVMRVLDRLKASAK